MTVGDLRRQLANLPDEAPLRLYMIDCPDDNLDVRLEGIYPSSLRDCLVVSVSIIDEENTQEDEE